MPATCLTSNEFGRPHSLMSYECEMEGLEDARNELKELVKEKIVWSDFAVGNLEGKKYLWSTCYV